MEYILICIIIMLINLPAKTYSLDDAWEALDKHNFNETEEILKKIIRKPEDLSEKAKALILLALLHWRYRNNFQKALNLLEESQKTGKERSRTYSSISRLFINKKDYGNARSYALLALLTATDPSEVIKVRILEGMSTIKPVIENMRKGQIPDNSKYELNDTLVSLREIVEAEPGLLKPSLLLLKVSLLVKDGETALKAWKSYYRIFDNNHENKRLNECFEILRQLLPRLRPEREGLSIKKSVLLSEALAKSMMFEEAVIIAHMAGDPELLPAYIREIIAYNYFISDLRELTDDYYLQTANKLDNAKDRYIMNFIALLDRYSRDMNISWIPESDLSITKAVDKINQVSAFLEKRYGAYMLLGETSGYFDLHYGHKILETKDKVEQYGHSAYINFIQLDMMVSNGFQSWAWDYRMQHGGGVVGNKVFQVRPPYAEASIKIFNRIYNEREKLIWLEQMNKASKKDLETAESIPYAYLSGMAERIKYREVMKLYEKLKKKYRAFDELKFAFITKLDEITVKSSIYAHEGRHIIDIEMGVNDLVQREFQAKLSEVIFSKMPFFSLIGPIYGSDMGADTSHGQANLMIIKGIINWMECNSHEIKDYRDDLPMILQLDKLSDRQLRSILIKMDSLAGRK